MIYQGEYFSNNIYGTSNKNKVKVQTADDATFLSCELEVLFNNSAWSHTFEIPFFNNVAELYFENYIHSIITQKFNIQDIDIDNYKFYDFDLASINMKLKEMQQNDVLSELEHDFYMILGKFDALSVDSLNSGVKRILPTKQTNFLTEEGILSFSFLCTNYPNKIIVNNGVTESQITLPSSTTNYKLHTVTIPIKKIASSISTALTLTLKFANGSSFDLGQFNVIDKGVDHNTVFFQNNYGTISIVEFNGEFKEDENYKTNVQQYSSNNSSNLNEIDISASLPFIINTGYIWDQQKYNILRALIKSYNKYLIKETIINIINNGTQKLMPYKSNYYLNNETLKFKLSENDDIHYRTF